MSCGFLISVRTVLLENYVLGPSNPLPLSPFNFQDRQKLFRCDRFHPSRCGCGRSQLGSISQRRTDRRPCPLYPQKRTLVVRSAMFAKCQKRTSDHTYSITSSAVASRDWGIVRPSSLAVLRLMTNSNFVGCSTGRSAGLAPLKMRST